MRPHANRPACPGTLGSGKPGRSAYGISVSTSMVSATPSRPDPRTSVATGRSGRRSRTASVAERQASPGGTAGGTSAAVERGLQPDDRLDRRRIDSAEQARVHTREIAHRNERHQLRERRTTGGGHLLGTRAGGLGDLDRSGEPERDVGMLYVVAEGDEGERGAGARRPSDDLIVVELRERGGER